MVINLKLERFVAPVNGVDPKYSHYSSRILKQNQKRCMVSSDSGTESYNLRFEGFGGDEET